MLSRAPHVQLVVITPQPGEEIGRERHTDGERHALGDGMVVVIPAGTEHAVVNMSVTEPSRLSTLSVTLPEHLDGTVQRTNQEAEACERSRHP